MATVAEPRLTSSVPRSLARSAARSAGPLPLETMARLSSRGRKPQDKALAAKKSWSMFCTRTTPARRIAASKTTSASPALSTSGALLSPRPWRPALSRMIGLTREAERSALMKRRALRT